MLNEFRLFTWLECQAQLMLTANIEIARSVPFRVYAFHRHRLPAGWLITSTNESVYAIVHLCTRETGKPITSTKKRNRKFNGRIGSMPFGYGHCPNISRGDEGSKAMNNFVLILSRVQCFDEPKRYAGHLMKSAEDLLEFSKFDDKTTRIRKINPASAGQFDATSTSYVLQRDDS